MQEESERLLDEKEERKHIFAVYFFLSSLLLGCELLFEISEPLQSIQMTPFQSMFEPLQVHIQGSQVDKVLLMGVKS